MSNIFPQKHPGENFPVAFDFSAYTDAIVLATLAVSVLYGTDANPAAILSGAPQIDAGVVTQRVAGGVSGVHYIVKATVTDGANTWVHEHILPVGGLQ